MFAEPDKAFGFFATRWCEAADERSVELAIIDSLRREFAESVPSPETGEAEPSLHLVEIERLDALPNEYSNGGAAWFPTDRN